MTLVSVFRALVTSDVVTVATHCCCVPIFITVIAMNVAFSVVDVVIAVVVFVGAAVAVVFTAVCFVGARSFPLSGRYTVLCYRADIAVKALPHVTISSTISSTFHRRRWNIVDIVNDEPATRNDNVNDANVK